MNEPVKQYKMNLFDPIANSNKVWIGKVFSDGTFTSEWGRVLDGGQLATKSKKFDSRWEAENELDKKYQEKLRKGYEVTKVIDGETVIAQPAQNLAEIAAEQISGAEDKTTLELIKYIAEVNIHNITSSTSIKFNSSNATFTTPLGVLSPEAIREARGILGEISGFNSDKFYYKSLRTKKITDYFRIVPHDFGRKVPDISELLETNRSIQKENDILDALEAALSNVQTDCGDKPKLFKCRLTKLPHWTEEGKNTFRRIRRLFEQTRNSAHITANLKLTRVYEVEIEDMVERFEKVKARIGNVRQDLWHGTKASNLLSILKNGLIIPPASSAHCTGRMFGNGIYTSLQSTKALNYATNMWNRSGKNDMRRFMFLCDAVLGKTFKPQTSSTTFPVPGSDSTWVEAGSAGVLNHECIVYDISQINLRYLCEFGEQ